MKKKTIIKNVTSKMNDWLESIDDKSLRRRVKINLMVTGGALTSMLTDTKVNDYDVYIKSRDVLKELIAYYMQDKFGCDMTLLDYDLLDEYEKSQRYIKSDINISPDNGWNIAVKNLKEGQLKLFNLNGTQKIDILDIMKKYKLKGDDKLEGIYDPLFYSSNAITLTNGVQVIIRFWGDAEEIHKNFDFVHTTNYFTFNDDLVTNVEALESLLTKELKYRGSLYPVTSIIRVRKFLDREFTINAGELFKIMFQISKLDLEDSYVLEEQLMGVDVAYFNDIVRQIRDELSKDPTFKITMDWLFTLIDNVFYESNEEM